MLTDGTLPLPATKATKVAGGVEGVVTCCGMVKLGVSAAGVTVIVTIAPPAAAIVVGVVVGVVVPVPDGAGVVLIGVGGGV